MRLLILLIALCCITTVQAAEIDASVRAGTSACASHGTDDERHAEAPAPAAEASPANRLVPGGSEAGSNRNPMSQRWHSLLPGMFR